MNNPTPFRLDVEDMRRQFGDDDELIADVIALFLADYPGRLQALNEAAEARDLRGVRTAAHTLKGSAGAFGAFRIVSIAAGLENANAAESFYTIRDHVACLTAEVEQLADALRLCQVERPDGLTAHD